MTTVRPFAALQSRLNSAVLTRLSNATAVIGTTSVPVIFDCAYSLAALGPAGMAGSSPVCTVQSAALPVDVVGQPISIDGKAYTVAAHEPDGTGLSRLWLEVQA